MRLRTTICLAILATCFRTEGRSALVPAAVGKDGILKKKDVSGLNLNNRSSVLETSCGMKEHMSVVISDRLYFLGGKVQYKKSNGLTVEPNQYIRFINLGASFRLYETTMNMFRYTIPARVPDISQGSLWPDNGQLVILGGKTETVNTSTVGYTPPSKEHEVWRYKSAQSGGSSTWVKIDMSGGDVPRAFSIAGTYVDNIQMGFLLGGLVSSESMANISPSEGERDVGGLAIWDGRNNIWAKETTPWEKRHAAKSFYLRYGRKGVLVYIGGMAGNDTRFPFDQIDVYDIANHKWLQQTATGDIPSFRKNFCGTVISAQDLTSHQIYIFGGSDENGGLKNGVHVLNLPTFVWRKVFADDDPTGQLDANAPTPREHMTCNIVSGKYMLIYGGELVESQERCERTGVFVLDLSTWAWEDRYVSGDVLYTLPTAIVDNIGGSALGGATKVKPTSGFNSKDLEALLSTPGTLVSGDVKPVNSTQADAPPPHKPGPTASVVASATISAVVVVASLIGGWFYYKLWRRVRPVELDSLPAEVHEKYDDRRPPVWPPQELPLASYPIDVMRYRAELSEANYGNSGAREPNL